jgi:hypothetical protein
MLILKYKYYKILITYYYYNIDPFKLLKGTAFLIYFTFSLPLILK